MTELVKNAWLGWLEYTENGKMAALLLLCLLIFWFWKREGWNKYRKLFIYTTVVTVCCIVPFCAAVLMLYQTKFYDYEWIWNLVPITCVISLACTMLWTELIEKYKDSGWKKVGVTLLIFGLLYLCNPMGTVSEDTAEEQYKLKKAEKILDIITEKGQNTNILLWAPEDVMEYARAVNGSVRLPYGRNMWDPALNAYSYETYGEVETAMYQWMVEAEESGKGDPAIVEVVLESGVNHILLPGNLEQDLLQAFEDDLGVHAEITEEYYWFCIE